MASASTISEQTRLASIEAAKEKIYSVKAYSIVELKAFNNPPQACQSVFEGLGVLFEPSKEEFRWDDVRKLLLGKNNNFIRMLLEFDTANITEDQLTRLSSILAREECRPEVILTKSKACYDICMWLHGTLEYAILQRQMLTQDTE